jgi:non-ribosomal peptide synthetase component F
VQLNRSDGIDVGFSYSTDLFEATTIHRMGRHLAVLLESVVQNPMGRLSQLALAPSEELQLTLRTFNDTAAAYPDDKMVHQLFESYAALAPGNACLNAREQQLTYAAVNAAANQLAHWLVSRGVAPGTAVGVSSHKCPQLYISLLAVLKAGGAYVPLDPTLPLERAAFMVQQTGVQLLLTSADNALAQLPGIEAVVIDQGWQRFEGQPMSNLPARCGPADLAYCVFTSGSTGQPKVMQALIIPRSDTSCMPLQYVGLYGGFQHPFPPNCRAWRCATAAWSTCCTSTELTQHPSQPAQCSSRPCPSSLTAASWTFGCR